MLNDDFKMYGFSFNRRERKGAAIFHIMCLLSKKVRVARCCLFERRKARNINVLKEERAKLFLGKEIFSMAECR